MPLEPRWEARDFRDREQRQQTQLARNDPNSRTVWDHMGKAFRVLGVTAFVGLTMYNIYVIGGWLSDWYAKRRADRAAHWRRARTWKRQIIEERCS
jgi:hypothetical protein